MSYVERTDEEIIEAYERWLVRHPEPDKAVFGSGCRKYSPREIIEAVKNRELWAVEMCLKIHREAAKYLNEDPVEVIDRNLKK